MINHFKNTALLWLITSILCFSQTDSTLKDIFDSFSIQNITRHMDFLASDIFEGRGTGTTGGNLAAKYIALEYARYGLKPIGDANTFYQYIPMHGSYVLPSSEMKIYVEEEETDLNLSSDYILYKTGQQTFIPVPLDLVFVGYGIIAQEYDYNDYQSVDVEGKVVVMLSGEPESNQNDFFDGHLPTIYSYPESKQRMAISRGAAGSIIIPIEDDLNWEKYISDFSFEDVTLAYSVSSNLSVLINPEIADLLFEQSAYTFSDVLDMLIKNQLQSFPLNTQISFKGVFDQRDFLSANVAGIIEGTHDELKDSYLIITAHYDHLGIGKPVNGDSIYNGALDNAIGVSVMLELANKFTQMNNSPLRSIIFLATTGEEKGLLGSSYYVDHPLVPLYKTIANINIDGIAMFEDFTSIVGIGAELSSISNFLDTTAAYFDITIQNIPIQFKLFDAFNRSDQISFATAGIPSVLVLEGVKNKNTSEEKIINAFIDYMENIYHSPFDDLNQKINYDAVIQHSKVLFYLSYLLVNSEISPTWHPGVHYNNARLRSIAEKK